MSNRRLGFAIGGFLILLVLSLIGWEIVVYNNFPIFPFVGLMIGAFGIFLLGIVFTSDDQ